MNKRICPDELVLSEYMSGSMAPAKHDEIERHIAACPACRVSVSECHHVLKMERSRKFFARLVAAIKRNAWLICSVAFLGLSFIFPRYFLQFLAAGSLAGVKWIIDSKTTKMLITVYEALKHTEKDAANEDEAIYGAEKGMHIKTRKQ